MDKLIKSSKFWFGVWALAQAVIAFAVPNFPKEIKLALDALVAIVITAVTVDEIGAMVKVRELGANPPPLKFQRAGWWVTALGVLGTLVALFIRR